MLMGYVKPHFLVFFCHELHVFPNHKSLGPPTSMMRVSCTVYSLMANLTVDMLEARLLKILPGESIPRSKL